MALIDAERAEELYAAMGAGRRESGGSAANTIAGVASFGGTAAFIGKVARRPARRGVRPRHPRGGRQFVRHRSPSAVPTGRCLILVTPRRAAHDEHLPRRRRSSRPRRRRRTALIAAARSRTSRATCGTSRGARQAFRKAAERRPRAGRPVALTLSDSFCVDRHRDAFLDLVAVPGRRAVRERARDHRALRGRRRSTTRCRRFATTATSPRSPARRTARSSSPATRCTWSTRTRRTSSTPRGPAISTRPASSTRSLTTCLSTCAGSSRRVPRPR